MTANGKGAHFRKRSRSFKQAMDIEMQDMSSKTNNHFAIGHESLDNTNEI